MVRHVEYGDARVDEPGHEHFDFRDGISQPGIRGFTVPTNPDNPDQGIPGQELLWPGEFVLGYPAQAGPGFDEVEQGSLATAGPEWMKNGSYLVLRRLPHDAVIATAPRTGEFSLPGGRTGHVALMQRFVTTTGDGYFFQPSLSALALLSATPPADTPATTRPPRPNGTGRPRRPGRRPRCQGGRGNGNP